MDSILLKTKILIPPIPNRTVDRNRLVETLERGCQHAKLILLSAPAGYGKTTLLSQWARASHFPIAWLTLDSEDNDIVDFFRYLLSAWDLIQPDVSQSPFGLLLSGRSPDMEAVQTAFIHAASEIPEPAVFVLDDYHYIEKHDIHHSLAFLIDHLPPTHHFVLASREEPPLPIARYRAHQEVLEINASDLQFMPEETKEYFAETIGLSLEPEETDSLQRQTEGWIAGLQLARLSLKQFRTAAGKLTINGRQRFITDYLREDVFMNLPDDTQHFLLRTSFLNRLCSSLVETVTVTGKGQEHLENLERKGLFLTPLDDHREWYRYHPLFADFLQEELKRRYPKEIPDLHQRAAQWYLDHDLAEQAFDHAIESQSAELVINILERNFIAKLMSDNVLVVKSWLDALPVEWQAKYPIIGIAQAGLLMVTGQFDACARRLDEIEQLVLGSSDYPDLYRGKVIAMRCNVACFQNDLQRAQALANQALQFLAADDLDFRAGIYGSLGDTYRRNGLWKEAKNSYIKLLDFINAPGFHVQAVHIYGALADLELRQGYLQKAAGYWEKALAALQPRENWGNVPLPLAGWVYIRMGEIYYEWNELEKAWQHLSRGLERAQLGGDARSLIAGYVLVSRLKLTEGETGTAAEYLERAQPLVKKAQFSDWASRFERFQVELWLAQDQLRVAVDWANEVIGEKALRMRQESETTQLTAARVLIVKGDMASLERALGLLSSLIQTVKAEGRMGLHIKALALQALLYWKRSEQPLAMSSLEEALRLAEPEGYVRLFADLGLPMVRLLQEARARDVMPEYSEKLLTALGTSLPIPANVEKALIEPLTPREMEILGLMAVGQTNREIAEKLVLSPETVKKHAGNIYQKLGVNNRTQAVAQARALALLD